jgi:NAD(P)-dependent dehydrogenase (short-subunit alcohol dehydrogenase family)
MSGRRTLLGQRVLITGAAHGIGAATARKLRAAGARLILLDNDQAHLQRVGRELEAEFFPCDVRDLETVQGAVESGVNHLGGLDAAVSNAGVHVPGRLQEASSDVVRRIIDTNLLGTWNTLRAATPFVASAQGYLLAVSSIGALVNLSGAGAYCAAKAGVHALVNSTRLELRDQKVAVGCAYFGVVETDLIHEARRIASDKGGRRSPLRPLSAEAAGEAIALAIRKRSRWVVRPPLLYPVVAISNAGQMVIEVTGWGLDSGREWSRAR